MINIAVCGKFHVLNYIPYIYENKILNMLYMSHKSNTIGKMNISEEIVRNFPLKEYLTQFHGKFLGNIYRDEAQVFYNKVWEKQVLNNWCPAEQLHLLAQGAGLDIVKRAKAQDKSKILIEVVNTHPLHRLKIIQNESDKWNITSKRYSLFRREELLLEEVNYSDALLAPTNFVANTYRSYGYNKPIYILPYAANTSRFNPDKIESKVKTKDKLRIISVGQIGLRKGQLYLLNLLDFFPNIELTLIGTVDQNVLSLFKKYIDRVNYFPRVPSDEMPKFLSNHDVFISASLEEGLAVSICEAMSMGLAVIATKESGAEEIIQDKENGLLFEAGNFDQLKECLQCLIDNRELCYEFGALAKNSTLQFINWKSYSEELLKVYNSSF